MAASKTNKIRHKLGLICAQRDRLVQHVREKVGPCADGTSPMIKASTKAKQLHKQFEKQIQTLRKQLPDAITADEVR